MSSDDHSAVLGRYRSAGHLQVPTKQAARPSGLLISKRFAAPGDSLRFDKVEPLGHIGTSR